MQAPFMLRSLPFTRHKKLEGVEMLSKGQIARNPYEDCGIDTRTDRQGTTGSFDNAQFERRRRVAAVWDGIESEELVGRLALHQTLKNTHRDPRVALSPLGVVSTSPW